jgi:hypothetical protein
LRDERCNSFGVRQGHGALGFADHARPCVAPRQIDSLRERLAQQSALVIRVRAIAGRPERGYSLTVGFDQGDVDAVQRGAAHQTDCRHHRLAVSGGRLVPNARFL